MSSTACLAILKLWKEMVEVARGPNQPPGMSRNLRLAYWKQNGEITGRSTKSIRQYCRQVIENELKDRGQLKA
jgi:hypothetical protein